METPPSNGSSGIPPQAPPGAIHPVISTVAAPGVPDNLGDYRDPMAKPAQPISIPVIQPETAPAAISTGSAEVVPTVIDDIPPISEAAQAVTPTQVDKTKARVEAMSPKMISAQDGMWGDNPGAFWEEQAKACESYEDSRTAADLIEFADRLRASASATMQPWLEPIQIPEDADLWIIGDLHGDLLALRALTEFAKRMSKKQGRTAVWCFLGDLFDDGPYGHAVLREVLGMVVEKTGFFVVGNHDLSLSWDAGDGRFNADVSPHDFADWLNKTERDSAWRKVAIAATQWFKTARRALLLADGTMVAHGGCVHADRLTLLAEPEGYLQPSVLEDLVWLRAHENSKRKIPNRTARGCQFGFEDFRDFLKQMSVVARLQIHRVIRGHDHVLERWASPARYDGRLLTINAMSWRQREATGPFVRRPVVARHRPNEFPEIFQLEIPAELVQRLYGEKGQTECGTSGK